MKKERKVGETTEDVQIHVFGNEKFKIYIVCSWNIAYSKKNTEGKVNEIKIFYNFF